MKHRKHLVDLIDRGLVELDEDVADECGRMATALNLSQNRIAYVWRCARNVRCAIVRVCLPPFQLTPRCDRAAISNRSSANFASFTALDTLVLDNNELSTATLASFPSMASVTTLWLNNNLLADLEETVDAVCAAFPSVSFLSMMENPLNPGPFVMGLEKNYERYRMYIIHKLPGLKMLDATPVTATELVKAQKVGHLQLVRKVAAPRGGGGGAPRPVDAAAKAADDARTRQIDPRTRKLRKPTALLGIRENHYDGRQSEGNRFITDDNL